MAATKTKQKSANLKVTLALRGWPKEVRQLSVVDAYWYVELQFSAEGENVSRLLTYYETDDYAKALAKYNTLLPIVGG